MVNVVANDIFCAIVGGAILAIATSLNFLLYGHITGISGSFHTVWKFDVKNGFAWKYCFLAGMVLAPFLIRIVEDRDMPFRKNKKIVFFDTDEEVSLVVNYLGSIIGGLLVGIGSKLQNGCTSGHGLCGMARFAPRSIFAVIVFLIAGIATATVKRKLEILETGKTFNDDFQDLHFYTSCAVMAVL